MRHSIVVRRWWWSLGAVAVALTLVAFGHPEAQAQQQKPNILVIMGADLGQFNVSAYNLGMHIFPI
jgi:arylsulfatase